MQRNQTERGPDRRRVAEQDAAQPMGGLSGTGDDEDALEKSEDVPSFLTAQELRAREPVKREDRRRTGADRRIAASLAGSKAEPGITDDEPARAATVSSPKRAPTRY